MKRIYLLGMLVLSMPAFASNWQTTYHATRKGTLMVDSDSIVESGRATTKKFWTLYAPRVSTGEKGAGYAYNMMQHVINCTERTAALVQAIYYDEFQVAHESEVANKALKDIVPDSEDDFLWTFVCKPDQQAQLSAPTGKGMPKFLEDQAKFTRDQIRNNQR